MIEHIERPAANVTVVWLPASEGGRASGPPTVPVYAANCAFPLGNDVEVMPGWPATAEKFSLLLQKIDERPDGIWFCNVGFLAPDLVAPYLSPGASMLVMEGPKVVGTATIHEVFIAEPGDDQR